MQPALAALDAAIATHRSSLAALEALRPLVAETRPADDDGLISQVESKLGRRTHINITRKMLADGTPGAFRRGRLHYITRAVHDAALAALSARKPSGGAPPLASEYLAP